MTAFCPDAVARAVALIRAGHLDVSIVAGLIGVEFSLTKFGVQRRARCRAPGDRRRDGEATMMMRHKVTDIVAYLMREGSPVEIEHLQRLRASFPGVTDAELRRAFDAYDEEVDERFEQHKREYAAHKELYAQGCHLHQRFPQAKTLDEAVEMGIACRDPVALQLAAIWNTEAYRLEEALGHAALRAHPQWTETEEGHFDWTGEGEMPPMNAMIEWFQMTHPTEAREIERQISQDA